MTTEVNLPEMPSEKEGLSTRASLGMLACIVISAVLIFWVGHQMGWQNAKVDSVEQRVEAGYEESKEAEQRRLIVREVMQELKVHGVIK